RTTKINYEVCQLVDSIHGKTKLNVRGYLLVKDKNQDEKYYWCCEYKNTLKCNRRATANLVGEEHLLMKFVKHNYAPITSHVDVVQTLNSMRNAASGIMLEKKHLSSQPQTLQDIDIPNNL
ncbi:13243_t:CDS:2, partial [Dentiscutata heterogama]